MVSNTGANSATRKAPKMTIITREDPTDLVVRRVRPRQDVRRRPRSSRPQGAAHPYRGTGVLMSRASHRRRPITPLSTVLLALVAAAITVWLGLVVQLGGSAATPSDSPAAIPSQLAVVRVQSGESLQQLAQRIAPDAPATAVVDQIRELNKLDSGVVAAGRTLIAPVG
jgi:LysM domain